MFYAFLSNKQIENNGKCSRRLVVFNPSNISFSNPTPRFKLPLQIKNPSCFSFFDCRPVRYLFKYGQKCTGTPTQGRTQGLITSGLGPTAHGNWTTAHADNSLSARCVQAQALLHARAPLMYSLAYSVCSRGCRVNRKTRQLGTCATSYTRICY